MNGVFILNLSNSQRMALIDLIGEHLRCPKENQTEEFIDASTQPATKTTSRDLLRLINDARWERE